MKVPDGEQLFVVPVRQGPSRRFQPKSAPAWPSSTSSQAPPPTSLMKNRCALPLSSGSNATRKGLRRRVTKISWHITPLFPWLLRLCFRFL